MTMPISGNATLVNVLLRWPAATVATLVVAVSGVAAEKVLELPPTVIAQAEVLPPIEFEPPAAGPLPVVQKKPELKPVDDLCPPTIPKNLTKKQKKILEKNGCKIKG